MRQTLAEVIATKLFCAIGYNTPEDYIVTADPLARLPGVSVSRSVGDRVLRARGVAKRLSQPRVQRDR